MTVPANLRLTIEYDGTAFCGFQWQPDLRTIAGTLEAALTRLLGRETKITGAGRTDAGVHATGQVVSLSTTSRFPFDRLALAVNSLLPSDLSVRETAVVDDGFSARFSASERTYVYAILNRNAPSALLARYAYHVPHRLDLAAMREAAAQLVGEHDFRSFAAAAGAPTVRDVRRVKIEPAGELFRLEIAADGFLHHMVRTIAGTLVECGLGRRRPGTLSDILAARDRAAAGFTAPPQGLFLAGVRYDGYDSFAEPPLFGGPLERLAVPRA
ncbi:MAG: tRNA pseudouridine(38-40) synthase TruA [Candidatus Eremiobacteraeota bacterium]|nr:tRNA pseudouridine(38-40) synthase TruA [Candidatus Eremiobacteraeota bacterium]